MSAVQDMHAESPPLMVPPRAEHDGLPTQLTDGEKAVRDFFGSHLSAPWEIYVQPHLNGRKPDFVLLNPHVGIAVFEVKDTADVKDARRLAGALNKVELYRNETANLYCAGLARGAALPAVTGGLILPFADERALRAALREPYRRIVRHDPDETYLRITGRQSLEAGDIGGVFPAGTWAATSAMNEEIAEDLRHWLLEPEFSIEQRRLPTLTPAQRRLIDTRTSTGYRRVRGPAGTGKSIALAGRVARLEREGRDVLVVVYNTTLINYLKDLARRFGCDTRRVTWLPFHQWCKSVMLETGLHEEYRAIWRTRRGDDEGTLLDEVLPAAVIETLQSAAARGVQTYDAILVDEAQDMKPTWWQALRLVLRREGEAVLMADRAQDIYGRSVDWTEERMVGAGFGGAWSELNVSHRLPAQLTKLIQRFVAEQLPHEQSPEPDLQQELHVDLCRLKWVQASEAELAERCANEVLSIVMSSNGTGVSPLAFADVVVLSDRNDRGREVAELLRAKNIQVLDTFSPHEETRRRQKRTFFKGSERMKATTIHSFKGWEGRALVVVLSGADTPRGNRVAYAALTRLKAHPHGSFLTVVSAAEHLTAFGRAWPQFVDA